MKTSHTPFQRPLIRIGYWAGSHTNGPWPSVNDFIDTGWDADERTNVALYLKQGIVVRAYMGYSECRICGRTNGNLELTDGTYVWPEGLTHYVQEHAVRLPAVFVEHLTRLEELADEVTIDDTWWLSTSAA